MKYISCFSGIGGLEASRSPEACCEIDPVCQKVLRRRFPKVKLIDDVKNLAGISAPVICGGWPCQDVSVAGLQEGLHGENSKLFFDFVETAQRVNAETIIAENVPNLLRMSGGKVFQEVLQTFVKAGYPYISWRTLNARNFELPHQRRRVFLVASKEEGLPRSLHRPIPVNGHLSKKSRKKVDSFYWTAGSQSICYSKGFIPTLKVGSSISIPSPPAVFYENVVRPLSSDEALRLQGFNPESFEEIQANDVFRLAGNAVALPVGNFVVDGVIKKRTPKDIPFVERQREIWEEEYNSDDQDGMFVGGEFKTVRHRQKREIATNLSDFIDWKSKDVLSSRAAGGLLRRLERSGLPCPEDLRSSLAEHAVQNA